MFSLSHVSPQHSEILYQLTPTKNIVEGLKNFGVSASTSDLVAVKICSPSTSSSSVLDQLHQAIQGQISDVTLIGTSELIALGPLTKVCGRAAVPTGGYTHRALKLLALVFVADVQAVRGRDAM